MRFCTRMGGEVTRLSWRKCQKVAPALRETIEEVTGWPVLAVAPDRDFVYLWNASRRDLITGMGGVVCREHARASYPLSTEIFHISDSLRAIGAYAAASNPSSE